VRGDEIQPGRGFVQPVEHVRTGGSVLAGIPIGKFVTAVVLFSLYLEWQQYDVTTSYRYDPKSNGP
jgi:hypothetical protein